jgi:hypothetical protein
VGKDSYRPKAREEELLVEALDDEILVCDTHRDSAHVLNETASSVWRACDGQRDVDALGTYCALDQETVLLALERLRSCQLLDEPADGGGVSRRVMLRRTAIAGAGVGGALPLIRSITLPTPAMAVTGGTTPAPTSTAGGTLTPSPTTTFTPSPTSTPPPTTPAA